jgi:hypothetical protein
MPIDNNARSSGAADKGRWLERCRKGTVKDPKMPGVTAITESQGEEESDQMNCLHALMWPDCPI